MVRGKIDWSKAQTGCGFQVESESILNQLEARQLDLYWFDELVRRISLAGCPGFGSDPVVKQIEPRCHPSHEIRIVDTWYG